MSNEGLTFPTSPQDGQTISFSFAHTGGDANNNIIIRNWSWNQNIGAWVSNNGQVLSNDLFVKKTGDTMSGTLTGTSSSFTSLTASNGFIGTLTGNNASLSSLTASNGFIGTLTGNKIPTSCWRRNYRRLERGICLAQISLQTIGLFWSRKSEDD